MGHHNFYIIIFKIPHKSMPVIEQYTIQQIFHEDMYRISSVIDTAGLHCKLILINPFVMFVMCVSLQIF